MIRVISWTSARPQRSEDTRRLAGRSPALDGVKETTEARQRWIGRVSLGYFPNGKRRIGTVSASTESMSRILGVLRAVLRRAQAQIM